jgi:hypothetical protein
MEHLRSVFIIDGLLKNSAISNLKKIPPFIIESGIVLFTIWQNYILRLDYPSICNAQVYMGLQLLHQCNLLVLLITLQDLHLFLLGAT